MNFEKQIAEDITGYQNEIIGLDKIKNNDWAFNYWILDKIFYEEQEIIESKIIDYHDTGIDAYEFFEDSLDLYLIQNKYYGENNKLTIDYIKNDFLLKPFNILNAGNYTHCDELQKIFNKYKNNKDFRVHLQLYVTNDLWDEKINALINKFNIDNEDKKVDAKIYYLKDIKEKYYAEEEHKVSKLKVEIDTVNSHTILNINTKDYKLKNVLDARYVFAPVITIYEMYKNARVAGYPLFDKNIREYLGKTNINKNIITTLQDKSDRENFFYYNNGITLICDAMSSLQNKTVPGSNLTAHFSVENPQIVNGCQTVNSIYYVLNNYDTSKSLIDTFSDTFVMLKILVIDRKNQDENDLYRSIVRFTNSQNAINEKDFVSDKQFFNRFQVELEKKGFCLLVKQSDKEKFKEKYDNKLSILKAKNTSYFEKYGLECKKLSDCSIKLEKLMQVILAFKNGGYAAYTKKCYILKFNSKEYNDVTTFMQNNITVDVLLNLYLLYLKGSVK